MANTDVTQPIIINAKVSTLSNSVNYIRRVCFVSLGSTSLNAGEYQEVDLSSYSDLITAVDTDTNKDSTELKKKFSSFYSFAGNKRSVILELGDDGSSTPQPGSPAETLKGELDTLNQALEALIKELDVLNQDPTTNAQAIITKQGEIATKQGEVDAKKAEYEKALQDESKDDWAAVIEKFKEVLTNNEFKCYWYILPKRLITNEAFVTFAKEFSSYTSKVYFLGDFSDTNPAGANPVWQTIKGTKSIIGFYDNTTEDYDLPSLVAGLFASYVFDISDTNPSSPFNYKILKGVPFTPFTSEATKQLIDENVNFLHDLTGQPVLLNGRCADGRAIDYWFQWDLLSFYLDRDLLNLILTGVNNPLQVIKYNQDGIDIIESRIKATLEMAIGYGLINEFAQGRNSVTGALEGLNNINMVSFSDYIEQKPKDYENEVYGGISFYVRIGRYIRQVVLDVTLV